MLENRPTYDRAATVRKNIFRTVRIIALIISLLLICGLLLSAYAGLLSPQEWHGYNGVMQMTFPIWIAATLVMLVIDIFIHRTAALLLFIALLCCWCPLFDFCPVNFSKHTLTEDEKLRSFTLLTYNVQNYIVNEGEPHTEGDNATIDYILDTDADIVCLQEGRYIPGNSTEIPTKQRERLYSRYPFNFLTAESQMVFSKYPIEPLRLEYNGRKGAALVAAYRVNIEGRLITIFNVHLKSIGLTAKDKSFYMGLTDMTEIRDSVGLTKQKIKDVKSMLMYKLAAANLARTAQVDTLIAGIHSIGGPNVIVCGDFNDVPGCTSLRNLTSISGLKQVYPEVCCGPTYTFNANRFYFRIDHVLYRGDMKPVDMVRGNIRCSDHYPLLTTFLLENNQ